MSQLSRTYNFSDGTTAYGSQVENEISTLYTAWNNHDSGVSSWTQVQVSGTSTSPMGVISSGATTIVSIDNTATTGDPILQWRLSGTGQFSLGVDDSDSDALCLTAASTLNGSNILRIDATTITWGRDHSISRSNSAGIVYGEVVNSDNASGSSNSYLKIGTGGSSGGDCWLFLNVSGATSWSVGVDNSDSDAFCITNAATIDGTNLFKITTGGQVQLGNGTGAVNVRINSSTSSGANTATMTNSPTNGNPAIWINVNLNGTDYKIPAWA